MSKKKKTKNKKSVEIEKDLEELDSEIEDLEEIEEYETEEEDELDEFEEFEDEEEKEVTIMDMLNRIVVCLIIIAVILAINTIVLVCKDGTTKKEDSTSISTVQNEYSTEDYDVSKMTAVDVKGAVDLFTSKKTYILYIGRSTCGACKTYVPTLNEVADAYGVTVQYLDINLVAKDNEYYDTLVKKMSVETALSSNEGAKEGTFGEFLGYTPMTLIIKNGKQVDGAIGSVQASTLEKMFDEYGLGSKK